MENTKLTLTQKLMNFIKVKKIPVSVINETLKESLDELAVRIFTNETRVFFNCNKTGEIEIYKELEVVNILDLDRKNQMTLQDAQLIEPNCQIGDTIKFYFNIKEKLNRITIDQLQHILEEKLIQKATEISVKEFENKVNTVVEGTIKSVKPDHSLIVDIDGTEAIVLSNNALPSDRINFGNKVLVYIYQIKTTEHGPQIFASRTSREIIKYVCALEIPEFEKKIVIHSVARIPNEKTMVAVSSKDPSLIASAYCCGTKMSIVSAISKRLGGKEKVFFVNWNEDISFFINQCLNASFVKKDSYPEIRYLDMVEDEEENLLLSLPNFCFDFDDQGKYALQRFWLIQLKLIGGLIGKKIIGWPQSEFDNEMQLALFEERKTESMFMEKLQVDDTITDLLIKKEFTRIEDLVDQNPEDLASIVNTAGFDLEIATEIINRAKEVMEEEYNTNKSLFEKLGGQEDLFCFGNLSAKDCVVLAKSSVFSLKDLCDRNFNEISSILFKYKTKSDVFTIITKANKETESRRLESENTPNIIEA